MEKLFVLMAIDDGQVSFVTFSSCAQNSLLGIPWHKQGK